MALLPVEAIGGGQPGRGNSARRRSLRGEFGGPSPRPAARIRAAGRPRKPRWTRAPKGGPAGREPRLGGPEKRAALSSLQKRALEVELKIPERTRALGKEALQMLGGLEQRIAL